MKPARLFLTPNQLYYLLSRFDDLGVDTGPTNVRLENILADNPTSSNYVSFLAQTQLPKIRSYDTDSIHSVTSARSLMSSMSQIISNMNFVGNSASKQAKRAASMKEDVRYLYSAFTKVPCLKISLDHRLRPIAGFEEFPFDTAVPMTVFKNLTAFEIADIDFRSIYGWHFLADNLQSLTLKRASLDDISDLLTKIVLDDMDQRRRRSSKTIQSPGLPLATPAGASKYFSFPGSISPTLSPPQVARPRSSEGPKTRNDDDKQYRKMSRSISPKKTPLGRKASLYSRPQNKGRRSSASSTSSVHGRSPRQSSSSLLLQISLPSHKWRFLKHLSVADNGLTAITAESLKPLCDTLQSLDLSSNEFTEIPDSLSSLVALRALNMSNCVIDSIRALGRSPLPAITVLNLRSNRLNSLAGIEKLKSLQRLDVRDNRLADPTEAARLTGMPDFYELYIRKNPLTKTHAKHRSIIFNVFRATPGYTSDIYLDGNQPDRGERRMLVERAPEPAPSSTHELTIDQVHETDQNATERCEQRQEGSRNTDSSNVQGEATSQKRKKGPKRRVVEAADHPITPPISSSLQSKTNTAFMTAFENQKPESGQTHEKATKASPTPLERTTSKASSIRPMLQDPPTHRRSQDTERKSGVEDTPRPALSRNISQSNEIYRRRIEALKNGQRSPSLRGVDSRSLSSQGEVDTVIRNHGATGILVPMHASQAPAINI